MSHTLNRVSLNVFACSVFAAAVLSCSARLLEAAVLYSDRAAFQSALGLSVTDDYEALAYRMGDLRDDISRDDHTNASMNAVFGETRYTSTGQTDLNLILENFGNRYYCSGCNGSYETDFTATSVGTSSGVNGVGFDIVGAEGLLGTHAFVTYGDNSTEDFVLPQVDAFWGIIARRIKKIHFGLLNGGVNGDHFVQRMAMDNLTIGSIVPEPGAVTLLFGLLVSITLPAPRRK